MRAILAVISVALALSGAAIAAPEFDASVNPEENFLVARILPNGNERTLGTFPYSVDDEVNQQFIRDAAQAAARLQRTNNPAWLIVIYCPTNSPSEWYVDGDICWRSDVSE